MGKKTKPLQRWKTIAGRAGASPLIQEPEGWVDAGDATEGAAFVEIAGNSAVATTPMLANLIVESAPSVDVDSAAWDALGTFQVTGASLIYASSRPEATRHFTRLIRYKIDSTATTGDWSICFRICLTLK